MLTIPLSTLGWIILKAREFDVKDVDTGEGGEADDDDPYGVLEDRSDDPVFDELTHWINDMHETHRSELVALFWLGRGEGEPDDFRDLVEQARGLQGRDTARYLLGEPLLADYLEEGLERLGYDSSEIESEVG